MKMNRNKLYEIVQGYIGMTPKDKGCTNWSELQEKMVNEIVNLSTNPTSLLSFEKPKKIRSTEKHNEIYMSDSGVAGTYVPNMSDEDNEKWKAKHITGDNERIEIRKSLNGTQMVIVVRKEKPLKYSFENREKWYDRKDNIKISMNGPLWMNFDEQKEIQMVIDEAKTILKL